MKQDEIIEMAEQAGFLTNEIKSYVISPYTFEDQDLYQELKAFAKLVRNHYSYTHAHIWLTRIEGAVKAEREACADTARLALQHIHKVAEIAESAIRARGKND